MGNETVRFGGTTALGIAIIAMGEWRRAVLTAVPASKSASKRSGSCGKVAREL